MNMNSINSNIGPIASDNSILRANLPRENLNIAHFNAQSLSPATTSAKLEEIKSIVRDSYLDVIGVCETWFKSHVMDTAVNIDGYKIYRNDRVYRRGGGVCLYVSDMLESRIVYEEMQEGICEALFIEIDSTNSGKILIGVIYLPHGRFRLCENLIADMSVRYERTIFMGDFNTNVFEESTIVRNFCQTHNLYLVHNCLPTHFDVVYHTTKLIDFFLISDIRSLQTTGQFQIPALNSHHALIYLSLKFSVHRRHDITFYRDYRNIDLSACERDLRAQNFDLIYSTNDSNQQVAIFNSIMTYLFDRHVPVKRRVIRRKEEGRNWFNCREIREARELRDMAFRAYKEGMNEVRWRTFCSTTAAAAVAVPTPAANAIAVYSL
ncbi:hypothetical protein CVS40_1278 [Lucilia cuprina]|nr:hypothetical protein CVS40_1278 [Lucilia cuprina]